MVSMKMPSNIAMILSGSMENTGKMLSVIKDFATVADHKLIELICVNQVAGFCLCFADFSACLS